MQHAKFELLLEKLQQEQERFRQERECRHEEFERRLEIFRARHDHLVDSRVRRLSLDGITLNVDEIKKQVREDSFVQRDNEVRQITTQLEQLKVDYGVPLGIRREKTEGENDFRIKKVLTFDSRYPTPLPHLTVDDESKQSTSPLSTSRNKTHTGLSAKHNFRRIGKKVNTLVRFSHGRRHTIAASQPQLHVPLHVNTIGEEFAPTIPFLRAKSQMEENIKRDLNAFEPTMNIVRTKTHFGFDDNIKREGNVGRHLNVPHMPHPTTRYPKLAIGRTTYIHMCKGLRTPKQKLQSVVAKLDSIKQFQINVR